MCRPHRMCNLMSDNQRHHVLVGAGRHHLIIEEGSFPVDDETPVFHGPGTKVRHSYVVWNEDFFTILSLLLLTEALALPTKENVLNVNCL